jgi:cation:H+ antiporter
VFAAVATALPETIVPIVAVFAGGATLEAREHIAVGAIVGSSFMLSSLALALVGLFAARKRSWLGALTPEPSGLKRDLLYFIGAFLLAGACLFLPADATAWRAIASAILVAIYAVYVFHTVKMSSRLSAEGHGTNAEQPTYLQRIGLPANLASEILQLIVGAALIVLGAKWFVSSVEYVSQVSGIAVLILSLLIIPFATELPEKVNSILWIVRRKDTLAFGNITGAMVFQGTLLPAFGIQLASWRPETPVLIAIGFTLFSSLWLLVTTRRRHLRPAHLLLNLGVYVAFVITLAR